jgi:CelD/BcsL family acetyltransferase involved in cellulose biosynthesis
VGFVNDLEMREMLRAAAQKAALRASLMYVGDRPIAFAAGILSNKTLYGTSTGYDPGFNKYRPGLQCMMHLIEESFEPNSGLSRFDAGCGDSSYKRTLFGSSWKEAPVWIFAPSARGLRLHVLKLVSTWLHSLAMRLLAKSNHLRKVKNAWRQQALRNFNERDSR